MSNSATSVDPRDLMSRLRPMRGRDPHENGRVASNLELLFDLTFAVAIANGASQLAESLSHHEVAAGLGSFIFTSFGIIWAWINYSWFSSAYDTDDWLYRLLTLAQMVGVIVFTLGIPQLFHSVEHGHFDNTVIVAGYVIMRLVMLAQWLRAIRNDPVHRRATMTYAVTLLGAQVLWVGTAFLHDTNLPLWACFSITTTITFLEMLGPVLAERGQGTPWHAHHICERHGLLT